MTLWPLYAAAARLATPAILATLAYRAATGKEDPARLDERWGRTLLSRPPGPLVWFHAASVGESLSLLPLLERMLDARPELRALVTTVTTSSAAILTQRLPAGRAWHQYSPIDHPSAIRRFLDHWTPDLAVWVESELWPNLILTTRARGIRMALVNARMSERSWRGWRYFPQHIKALSRSFDLILAQDQVQAARWRDLGAEAAESVGNLKGDPAAPGVGGLEDALAIALAGRPRWLAASTHAGEEQAVIDAHLSARTRHPGLLTILAPRHPSRTDEVMALIAAAGLTAARRSSGDPVAPATEIWLIDTLGELGSIYPLVPIILIAGSFGQIGRLGGHNPAEAAASGAAILFGQDMENSAELAEKLVRAGAAIRLDDERSLALAVTSLLSDAAAVTRMGAAAKAVAAAERGGSEATFERLQRLLPPLKRPVQAGADA